jgi:hypothetical protein
MLREDYIKDTAKTLNQINYQIAELTTMKQELEQRLCATLEHGEEGQKTYVEGRYKITVRTGYNYVLDKEKYDMLSRHLNSSIDPVVKEVKYVINKKTLRESYQCASEKELQILNEIIKKNPAKINIQISAGI